MKTASGVVAMLRGINLGGHHRVKMEALRAAYERLGFQNVSTYIQSGNVIFSAAPAQLTGAEQRIDSAFAAEFGFPAPAVLRTASELRDVVTRSPFAGRDLDPAKIAVAFLRVPASAAAVATALEGYNGAEEVAASGRELYVYYPEGMGRTKLPFARIEKALGGFATARNWNTTTKLLDLTARLEEAPTILSKTTTERR